MTHSLLITIFIVIFHEPCVNQPGLPSKSRGLGGLNNRRLLSLSPGGCKSKIKASAGSVSPEASWMRRCRFLPVSSHGCPSVCVCVLISSYKDTGHTLDQDSPQ